MNSNSQQNQKPVHISINNATCQRCGYKLIIEENNDVIPIALKNNWKVNIESRRFLCPPCSRLNHTLNIPYPKLINNEIKWFIDIQHSDDKIKTYILEIVDNYPSWVFHSNTTNWI